MADPNSHDKGSGNGTLFFIVGALVVAVGVLYWLFGTDGTAPVATGSDAPAETNITIDNSTEAPAADAAPAADPVAPAAEGN